MIAPQSTCKSIKHQVSILPHWFVPSLLPLHLVGTSNSNTTILMSTQARRSAQQPMYIAIMVGHVIQHAWQKMTSHLESILSYCGDRCSGNHVKTLLMVVDFVLRHSWCHRRGCCHSQCYKWVSCHRERLPPTEHPHQQITDLGTGSHSLTINYSILQQ